MKSLGEFQAFFFFYRKILHAQNAYKRTKIKKQRFYALRKHLRAKSRLFAYLRSCAFCAFTRLLHLEITLMTSFTLLLESCSIIGSDS